MIAGWLSPRRFAGLQGLAQICWLLLTLLVAALFSLALKQGLVFETDIQALLPRGENSELTQRAGQRLFDYAGDKLMLVIGSPRQADALAAADKTRQILQHSPLVVVDTLSSRAEQVAGQMQLFTRHRFHLLSEQQRRLLGRGQAITLAQQALRDIYGLQSWSRSTAIAQDPLNLLQGYQNSLQAGTPPMELAGGHVLLHSTARPDWHYVLLLARSRGSSLNLAAQQAVVNQIDQIEQRLDREHDDISLWRSGIVFHAAAAARQARHEITLIGSGSAIGIVLLFLATFATLRPLLLSLASVLYGSLCAFTLCHYLFGTIHLLTLVFGASLIGVAIDYSLHYFTRLHSLSGEARGRSALRAIFPGLLLGLITTVIGYGSLAHAPLPGLRQIASFSVAGLVSAWLFVVAIYPLTRVTFKREYPAVLLKLAFLPWWGWRRLSDRQAIAGMTILSLACLGICYSRLDSADDVRALYQPSAQLLQQEQQIQALVGSYAANQFFLISAGDAETVLQLEEKLQPILEQLRTQGTIKQWNGISRYLPSIARQRQNYEVLERGVYGAAGVAWPLMTSIGFDQGAQDALQQAFVASKGDDLLPGAWMSSAGKELQLLWLDPVGGQRASMVTLQGIVDLAPLRAAAGQLEGVRFVDRVAEISELLGAQRYSASALLAAAYGSVMLLLLLRYKSPGALVLAFIPMLATLLSLSMLALAAIPISIFHVFALFLVLGLGMDYSIFAREAAPGDSDCRLAILLSALTSCLSFGLLALSSTPMVQAFGLTVLLGSLFNLWLVPLVDLLLRRHNST